MSRAVWDHPVLGRFWRQLEPWARTSEGWTTTCPSCDAENPLDRPRLTVATAGDRVRLRCYTCSALRIAVALNLELHEFEPWNAPEAIDQPPQPQTASAQSGPSRRRGQGGPREQRRMQADAYARLRQCVQAVLDAPAAERTRVLREQHAVAAGLPGVPADKARQAITAAAASTGLSQVEVDAALSGEEAWA